MSKDIEVVIRDADNVSELARIEQGYVPDDHVAMALVRAVNNACVQVGMEPPGERFVQAAEQRPRLIDTVARAQMNTINNTLTRMGYEHDGGALAVLDVVGKLEQQARVARALGDRFAPALAEAREHYRVARMLGEHYDSVEAPTLKPGEILTLFRAISTLGSLLFELRGIEPEPVENGDGSTTVTLTEAVTIGTPETAPEATS